MKGSGWRDRFGGSLNVASLELTRGRPLEGPGVVSRLVPWVVAGTLAFLLIPFLPGGLGPNDIAAMALVPVIVVAARVRPMGEAPHVDAGVAGDGPVRDDRPGQAREREPRRRLHAGGPAPRGLVRPLRNPRTARGLDPAGRGDGGTSLAIGRGGRSRNPNRGRSALDGDRRDLGPRDQRAGPPARAVLGPTQPAGAHRRTDRAAESPRLGRGALARAGSGRALGHAPMRAPSWTWTTSRTSTTSTATRRATNTCGRLP